MNYRVGVFLFGVFSLPVLGLIISLQGGGGDAFSGVMPVFCIITFLIVIKKIYDEFSFGANNRWDWWFSLSFSLPLCAVVFISVEPDFRILADETNLLSTSYALYSGFQFINITEKLFFFNLDHIISAEPAYRPALYPTLTAMLHYAFGFRWFNGIVLNFFVGLLSLSLLQFVLTKFGGRLLGVTGACLLASMPLFQLNITSSGFDALNSLMIMAVYYQLYRFNERPNANQAELLIALGILAAQARYETLVLILPITLILLANVRNLVRENYTPCLPLMPILAFPIVWQKIITQSFANAGESPDNVLSFYNVPDNALQALLFFFDFGGHGYDIQKFVSYVAIFGFALFLVRFWRYRNSFRTLFILIVLGQLSLSLAQFSYYTGNYNLPWVSRLAQIQLIFLVPFAAIGILHVFTALKVNYFYAISIMALFIALGVQDNRLNVENKSLLLHREFKYARAYLLENYPPKASLILNERSGMYVALGYSALHPASAAARQENIKENIKYGLFQHVLQLTVESFGAKSPILALEKTPHREVGRFQISSNQYLVIREYEIKPDD